MISPVSFSSTATVAPTDFQERIKKPQAYIKNDATAASGLKGGEEKSTGSKIVKVLVGAAVAATALALGSKTGIFKVKEGGNKIVNSAKGYLDSAGNFILKKATAFKNLFKAKGKSKLPEDIPAK